MDKVVNSPITRKYLGSDVSSIYNTENAGEMSSGHKIYKSPNFRINADLVK
jgi:hypothetical protein